MPVSANIETECFLLFGQQNKSQVVCNAACPDWLMLVWNDATSNPWLLSRWNKEEIWRKTHINALELLAIVAAVWARRVSHLSHTQRDNRSVERMSDPQMRPASAFLGRLNFLLSTSYTSVGRTATQPLVDRASNRHKGAGPSQANKHRCTHSMTRMLNFLEQLFAHLPPLVLDFRSQQRPKVVIYTVTSFSEHRNRMFSTFRSRNQKSIRL